MNAVSNNLKELRLSAGLTQDALAEKLHVTRQSVSNWETGRSEPDLEMLQALADALGVELTELIYGKKPEPYEQMQKKYKICSIVCAVIVLAGIVCRFTLRSWLLAYRSRTFDPIPYSVYAFGAVALFTAAAGVLFCSLLSLGLDLRLKKPWRILCLVLGICCLAPALATALQFATWNPAKTGNTLPLIFPFLFERAEAITIWTMLMPFLGGAGIFLGLNRK